MQGLGSDQSQRALTAPEELNGGVTSAITIFHITGIIPQVVLLYGANSQGNCHFLLTEVLPEDPARPTKQEWITTEASDVRLSLLSGTSVDECVGVCIWKHKAMLDRWFRHCAWMIFTKNTSCYKYIYIYIFFTLHTYCMRNCKTIWAAVVLGAGGWGGLECW